MMFPLLEAAGKVPLPFCQAGVWERKGKLKVRKNLVERNVLSRSQFHNEKLDMKLYLDFKYIQRFA